MKHYLLQLNERNGEYLYTHTQLLRRESERGLKTYLNKELKNFYGGIADKSAEGGYYFFEGEVHLSLGRCIEISEACYEELKKTGAFAVWE